MGLSSNNNPKMLILRYFLQVLLGLAWLLLDSLTESQISALTFKASESFPNRGLIVEPYQMPRFICHDHITFPGLLSGCCFPTYSLLSHIYLLHLGGSKALFWTKRMVVPSLKTCSAVRPFIALLRRASSRIVIRRRATVILGRNTSLLGRSVLKNCSCFRAASVVITAILMINVVGI